MGQALAQALLAGGHDTTVWNRTRSKAEALAGRGAGVAPDLAAAVASADLVVTCLRDHRATLEVLQSLPATAFAGRTVVVFASSTPDEARRTRDWADARGIEVLSGVIMVPTPLIGTPEALVLYAGPVQALDRHRPVLEAIAARSEYVGSDPGRAALLDTAMLEVYFSALTAFLHASALVAAHGLSSTDFVPWASSMAHILPDSFAGIAANIDAGSHPGTEDRLDMELAALTHMVDASREAGLDSRLPELMQDLARHAVDRGHGADSWSRVVELFRPETGATR